MAVYSHQVMPMEQMIEDETGSLSFSNVARRSAVFKNLTVDSLSTDAGSVSGSDHPDGSESSTIDTSDASPPYNPLIPSIGSAGHATGNCYRCGFFPKGRCQNGYNCQFCHFGHLRQRKQKATKGKKTEANPTEDVKPVVSPTRAAVQPPPGVFHSSPVQPQTPPGHHSSAVQPQTPPTPQAPQTPPGFFGRPPPGLEDVKPRKNSIGTPVASMPLPPGSWHTSQPREEPVTLSLDAGLPELDLPEPPMQEKALKPTTNQYQSQYSVAGLDPTLPAKKMVTAFLVSY